MDIMSKLPSFSNIEDALAVKDQVDAVDEAEAKAERIKFHRNHVRNGPTKFKDVTAGQERRARQRWLDGRTRKARRAQIRQYHAEQREAASLRGNLQAAGVLPYVVEVTRTPEAARRAVIWIAQRYATAEADEFGRIEVTEQVVRDALENGLKRWGSIVGMPNLTLPEEYVLPVALAS